ncbi:MAG: amidohydrolase [Bacteroidales bacterium]|nr:amidohydrolase [Bacteroidales bacterium]
MNRHFWIAFLSLSWAVPLLGAPPADLIVDHAKVVTVDAQFSMAEAVAIRDGKIVAVGKSADMAALRGPQTRVIDAQGRMVLPGLYDSHVHPLGAALSEVRETIPNLKSLAEIFAYIRAETERKPAGTWIVIRYAFPTRLREARFPTKAELDAVAPHHPVLYHGGPAGVANSLALKVSGVDRNTKDPRHGRIVRDPKTGEPTGMLRNAYGVLKMNNTGLSSSTAGNAPLTEAEKIAAVKKLFAEYNKLGLTSVGDRNGSRGNLDIYLKLKKAGELTVRVNVARSFSAGGSAGEVAKRLDALIGPDGQGGPTGTGDEWVRIGPIKMFLDGGMLSGTAFMRQPWPKGATYQVTEDDYRGLLFIDPEDLKTTVSVAAQKNWQVTAHCAGEAGMDTLLDAYAFANRMTPIQKHRFCITHANFPSQHNLERCRELGVCADVQPAWLYLDGATLVKELDAKRTRWFQPFHTWLQYTTIGGGSDHMLRLDPLESTNPWSPWLGIWVAVTRTLAHGGAVHEPSERLSREQAIRLYTINNAYLHHEEQEKGSLEVGKLADLILIDRDLLTCPEAAIQNTKVLLTLVGGKIVHDAR